MSSTDSLREQIERIVTAEYYSPNAEPAVKRIDRVMHLIEQYGLEREVEGMQRARSRVLRRTEIPKDAKNPTRDYVVVLGEEIAGFINDDISDLERKKEEL